MGVPPPAPGWHPEGYGATQSRSRGERINDLLADYGKPLFVGAVVIIISGIALGLAVVTAIGALGLFALVLMLMAAKEPPRAVTPYFSATPVPDQVRRERLQRYLAEELVLTRGRIESVTDYTAVVLYGQRVNHILHLLLTVLTCGVWLIIWLVTAKDGGEQRHVLTVDQCGNIVEM